MLEIFNLNPDLARALLLIGPVLGTFLAAVRKRPSRHLFAGGLLSFLWLLVFLPVLNYAAKVLGWWTFETSGNFFLGIPFDILLGWAFAWGPFALFVLPRLNIWILTALAVLADVLIMPNFGPLIGLGENWLWGEAAVIGLGFLPAQVLARLTLQRRFLAVRSTLQALGFGALVLFFGPAVLYSTSDLPAPDLLGLPLWEMFIAGVFIGGFMILGVSGSQEFCRRGLGTPIPFDPPQRLVTSGPYAYLANPMQVSTISITFILGLLLWQPLLVFTAFYGWLFCVTVVPWHNQNHLAKSFPEDWAEYRRHVKNWFPRWRPAQMSLASFTVPKGSRLKAFLERQNPAGLTIKAGERLSYVSGNFECRGWEAISRALDHTNLALAFAGWGLRLLLFFRPGNLFRE